MEPNRLEVRPDSLEVLERGGWVHADTQGEAVRFALARAAFLDCLLCDEDIAGEVVDRLNGVTGADAIVDTFRSNQSEVHRIAEAHGVFTEDGHSGPNSWNDVRGADGRRVRQLQREARDLSRQLFSVVTGEDDAMTQRMVETVVRWTTERGVAWPWLVRDIVHWYRDKVMYLNPHGAWYGSVRRPPHEYTFSPIDDHGEPSPKLSLRRRKDETFEAYRDRARQACEAFLRQLDVEWPRGRVPSDPTSIERNVRWFFEHRLHGASKTALAEEEFTAAYGHLAPEQRTLAVNGRRKDVREGIRDAERLLSSSGVEFPERPAGERGLASAWPNVTTPPSAARMDTAVS